jgi:hypothetical protein
MPFSGIISNKIDELLAKNKTAFCRNSVTKALREKFVFLIPRLFTKFRKKICFSVKFNSFFAVVSDICDRERTLNIV